MISASSPPHLRLPLLDLARSRSQVEAICSDLVRSARASKREQDVHSVLPSHHAGATGLDEVVPLTLTIIPYPQVHVSFEALLLVEALPSLIAKRDAEAVGPHS